MVHCSIYIHTYSTVQYSTEHIQYSTAQHNTVRNSTRQHATVQYTIVYGSYDIAQHHIHARYIQDSTRSYMAHKIRYDIMYDTYSPRSSIWYNIIYDTYSTVHDRA